jgi:hypothetical protein
VIEVGSCELGVRSFEFEEWRFFEIGKNKTQYFS